ncbi:hypothetical protein EHM92_00025 [bacterium]|nr:MAG: hypothetical protein EHM92_00025 [bacterium]
MPGAYLATNLITSAATITPSTEDTAYPRANLYDKQAARVFKGTSLTSLTILIDFEASVQADTISLINHNLTASAVLSLKAGSGSPPSTVVATPVYRQHDLWKAFTAVSARYWLLTITDSNSVAIQIGQLLIGNRTVFPRARRIGESYRPAQKRNTISGETYAGVLWNYHLFERREFNPSFRVSSAAELAVLTALDASVFGNVYPFVYIPDASGVDVYYVRKEQDYQPQEIGRLSGLELAHDYQMTLVEESRGLEIKL